MQDESGFDLGDVLVTQQVGRTRYRTPEGYLYCESVRIASTKPLLYRADEMRNCRPQHGMVLMDRPADVLFSEDTLASFQGKDITNSHPSNLVDPKSWKRHSVGVVLNPRQGTGKDNGYLIADLLVKDASAIKAVEDGKCEVSCGYDQDHEEVKPGLGRFTRIIGNHVALVDKGRCGPQCAIGDEDNEDSDMTKPTMFERLRNAFRAGDEKAFDAELATLNDGAQRVIIEVNDEVHKKGVEAVADELKEAEGVKTVDAAIAEAFAPVKTVLDAILAKLEGKDAKEEDNCSEAEKKKKMEDEKAAKDAAEKAAKDKEEADAKEAADKKAAADADSLDAMTLGALRVQFQSVVSKAEVLCPGLKTPAFDGLTKSKKTIADQMCGLRKAALDGALKDGKRKAFVETVLGPATDTEKLSCEHMELAFNAASELARMANNAPRVSMDHIQFPSGPMTAARLQAINAESRNPAKKSA